MLKELSISTITIQDSMVGSTNENSDIFMQERFSRMNTDTSPPLALSLTV